MKPRQDLLDSSSPQGLEVFQLTEQDKVPSCHLYMEAQIFTPDSKRLILHRHCNPHRADTRDPNHQYFLCDLEDNCSLTQITQETGVIAPAVSPDGKYLYYFVDQTHTAPPRLTLKRVNLDGTDRRTVCVVDAALPGAHLQPTGQIYPLSTISSDGRRIAVSAFMGDQSQSNPDWGLLTFDIQAGTAEMVIHGPSWCNIHPQYCRSTDPADAHDLLIQENHGCIIAPDGTVKRLTGEPGADIHVISDNGTNLRTMPWGRDILEKCQGHQCWIGRSTSAITSTETWLSQQAAETCDPAEVECRLIASKPIAYTDHIGLHTPDGIRNDLARSFKCPQFHHFATDIAGQKLISDYWHEKTQHLYLAGLTDISKDPAQNFTYLLDTKSSNSPTPEGKAAHVHPFLSPDGMTAFFNSTESGTLQAYMIRNLPTV